MALHLKTVTKRMRSLKGSENHDNTLEGAQGERSMDKDHENRREDTVYVKAKIRRTRGMKDLGDHLKAEHTPNMLDLIPNIKIKHTKAMKTEKVGHRPWGKSK